MKALRLLANRLAVAGLTFMLCLPVPAAAQDRPELQTKVNQSVRSASNPLQLSEQVVASSTPPNSLRRDHDYLYIGYDYDTCVVGSKPAPG
jgi:hypothetical protein